MSVFGLVSHSLRTGEPMHQVLPTTLLDRLFYHHHHSVVVPSAEGDTKHCPGADEIQSLNYMYYAQGLVAVFQLLKVRIALNCQKPQLMSAAIPSRLTNCMRSQKDCVVKSRWLGF